MAKRSIKDNPLHRLVEHGFEIAGRFYSIYRAVVLDNEDPEGLNRLQVLVPVMNPREGDNIWAFPRNVWGGEDYGSQMLPQKGDIVWIEYEMGDVEHPVWSHAGYALKEKPKEFKNANVYGFKTPLGSIILINDNKDEEEILVKLNSNKDWINIKKDIFELESKLIKLGKNGDEAGVLGDTLKERLDELSTQVSTLADILSSHTHAGPAGPPIKAVEIKKIATDVNLIKNKYIEFLSKKIKIDK